MSSPNFQLSRCLKDVFALPSPSSNPTNEGVADLGVADGPRRSFSPEGDAAQHS